MYAAAVCGRNPGKVALAGSDRLSQDVVPVKRSLGRPFLGEGHMQKRGGRALQCLFAERSWRIPILNSHVAVRKLFLSSKTLSIRSQNRTQSDGTMPNR